MAQRKAFNENKAKKERELFLQEAEKAKEQAKR